MPRATPSWRRGASARRSRCGAATRLPSSRSRSRRPRRRGSTSCTSPASRRASPPTSTAGGTPSSSAELEPLLTRHPLREGLRAQQLLALYRSGRQSEALAAYRRFRDLLADELGLEPSPRLKELERRILRHDRTLDYQPVRASAAPGVQYVRNGDVSIAYQTIGDGELDLVLVHGWVCSFQPGWEWPALARFYERLAKHRAADPVRQARRRAVRPGGERDARSRNGWTTCGR